MLRLRAGASLCCIRPAVDPGSLEAPPGVPLGLLVDVQPSLLPRKKGVYCKIYFLTTDSSEKARVFSLHYYNIYTDGNRTDYLMNDSPSVYQLSYFNIKVKGYGNLPA